MTSGTEPNSLSGVRQWLSATPKRKRWVTAVGIYALTTLVFALFAPKALFAEHTPFNHFAHLAQAWLDGRLDLANGAPAYAHNNDFAVFEGSTFVTFPPFPALVLLPFVALAGSPEQVADGQVFLWCAGLAPALLFLALERFAEAGHSQRSLRENTALALCFAFGTVYFFCAVQGTVWFAAHVVGAVLTCAFLLFLVDCRYPMLAGLCIGLGFLTRAPLIFAAPLFGLEALRVAGFVRGFEARGSLRRRIGQGYCATNKTRLLALVGAFSVPVLICLCFSWWHNAARFDDPFEPGYRYLTVAWQERMNKWGLFHYHYLAKNLGVALTSLPWLDDKVPFRINVHGLALWFTTPLYLWLLWPKARPWMHWALLFTAALVAVPTLFYQNTGWAQFGYRFSNDYAPLLFALLAVGMRPMRWVFGVAAVFAILVNGFGAGTFQRAEYRDYYYWQGSQKTLYQPD